MITNGSELTATLSTVFCIFKTDNKFSTPQTITIG